jgi:hypothetical protein
VVQPHAAHLQQLGRDARQPPAHHEAAHLRASLPQVHHLQEGAVVGAAFFQRAALGVEVDRQPRDVRAVLRQRGGRQHLLELDEAIAAEEVDLRCIQRVRGVEVGVVSARHGR